MATWAILAGVAAGGMSMGWLGGLLWGRRHKPEPLLVPVGDSAILKGDRVVFRGEWATVHKVLSITVQYRRPGSIDVFGVSLREFREGAMRPEREAERLLRLGPKVSA